MVELGALPWKLARSRTANDDTLGVACAVERCVILGGDETLLKISFARTLYALHPIFDVNYYNFDWNLFVSLGPAPSTLPLIPVRPLSGPPRSSFQIRAAHAIDVSTRASICSRVLPACKHTRTRSAPFGTPGKWIARALNPCSRR